MKKMKNIAVCIMAAWWFAACGNPVTSPERVDEWPDIYPDYIGVTIPATIAPMNFNCIGGAYERVDVTVTGGKSGEMHVNDKIVSFPQDAWQELLEENKGDSLLFTVCIRKDGEWKQYRSFPMYVSPYPIDYGVVYRKLAPGYEVYSKMGIARLHFESSPFLPARSASVPEVLQAIPLLLQVPASEPAYPWKERRDLDADRREARNAGYENGFHSLCGGVPLLASKRQIYCLFCQQYAPVFPCGEG